MACEVGFELSDAQGTGGSGCAQEQVGYGESGRKEKGVESCCFRSREGNMDELCGESRGFSQGVLALFVAGLLADPVR
jgi:hypothetical protein